MGRAWVKRGRVAARLGLATGVLVWGAAAALAGDSDGARKDTATGAVWFAVSDDADYEDQLSRVDPLDADPATNEEIVGKTGAMSIEALALQPGTGVLFAADAGRLGTVDPVTGRFSRKEAPIGSGEGADGKVEFDDIDGLTFDPETGDLYGIQRRDDDPDLLLRLDPGTGAHRPGAFADGADYAVVEPVRGLADVGDIAVSGGVLYAVANVYHQGGDRLVRVDETTGDTTEVGDVGADDVQGLCAAPDGSLHASTGDGSDDGIGVWDIDRDTGTASNHRPLDASNDYEGLACGVPGPAPTVSEPAPRTAPKPIAAPAPKPPAARPGAVAASPAPAPAPEVLGVAIEQVPELPRTGPGRTLALGAGAALAVGGLAIMGGKRRASTTEQHP
jgi:hypothetical protein